MTMKTPFKQVAFEDDDGFIHTLDVESKNEDNRTLTGWVTVYQDDKPVRKRVVVPDHRIQ